MERPYYGFETVDLSLHHGDGVTGHYRYWLEDRYPDVARELEEDRRNRERVGRRRPGVPGTPNDLYESLIPPEAHHSTWCAEQAVAFLDETAGLSTSQAADTPFFLWVGFPDPHHPWTPPAVTARSFVGQGADPPVGFADRPATPTLSSFYGPAGHDLLAVGAGEEAVTLIREYTNAQVSLIDSAVGRVVESLRRHGRLDDTVIVFTSDHGDFLGDYGLIRKGGSPARTLCHVSFILRAPGYGGGLTINHSMSNVDVLPTLLAALGVGAEVGLDGLNVLSGPPEDHAALIQTFGTGFGRSFSVVDDRYRFTYYPHRGERELYDHMEDPFELKNLAGADTPAESRLQQVLLERTIDSIHPNSGHLSPW